MNFSPELFCIICSLNKLESFQIVMDTINISNVPHCLNLIMKLLNNSWTALIYFYNNCMIIIFNCSILMIVVIFEFAYHKIVLYFVYF